MHRLACFTVLAVIALVCCAPSAADHQKPARPGSFVRYSAQTVDDLVSQIENNPVVAKRYAEHFGTSPENLARYFRENLKVITLKTPVKVRTYFISKNNKIASKQRVLPAGRRVYVTLAGELLIETDCGNPVTKKLPPKTKVLGTTETVPPLPVAEDIVLAPPVTAGPEVVEVFQDATTRALETAVEPFAAAGSAPSFLQIAEAVVPALAGLHYVQNRKSTPTVIPEPGSLVPLSVACSGLAAAKIGRKWRSRHRR